VPVRDQELIAAHANGIFQDEADSSPQRHEGHEGFPEVRYAHILF